MIVALEGCDASGKATHSKMLAEAIRGTVFSFPDYSTPVGKLIFGHLQSAWWATHTVPISAMTDPPKQWWKGHPDLPLDPMVFQCLQTVNRLELLPKVKAALAEGPVVFDRYWASGIVYGTLDGLERDWIERIQAPLPEPDAWLLLDIPAEEGLRRRPNRRDRYEKQEGLMEKVRVSYLRLFEEKRQQHKNWHVVDAVGTIDEVHARIMAKLPQLP